MKSTCPSLEELSAVLAANGREAGLRKHVLDSTWWLVDEKSPTRKQVMETARPVSITSARCQPYAASPMRDKLMATVRSDGWKVEVGPDGLSIDLGGKRRAKARLSAVEGRGASLYVHALPDPCRLTQGAAAFALHLTTFMRRVRASLLDFGHGPRLVWEAPLDPDDESDEQWTEALCCLANAVNHGQSEAEMLACDESTSAQWIEMNFPPKPQH